jgi:Flp pilus assembly protein TadG
LRKIFRRVGQTKRIGWYGDLMKRFRENYNKGQALVEFTLIFLLLLVIAWIPADFGLAFFTGQLASNASREGARIGAADPNYSAQVGSCVMPACLSLSNGTILKETARRMSSALLPGATITVEPLEALVPGSSCNNMVKVRVSGQYNYFFFRLLGMLGLSGGFDSETITRETRMRWEHQC